MMFMLEILGWFGLFVIMVVLLLIACKIAIITGYILCKLLWLAFNSISQFLRENVHLNAPVLTTPKKKKLRYYEDYSIFR